MSKLYYDHILVLDDIEEHIHVVAESPEEKEELWQLVDEIIHHEMMGCVLGHLHEDHHKEFLDKFHEAPHDEELIVYINERVDGDIEELLTKRMDEIRSDLVEIVNDEK